MDVALEVWQCVAIGVLLIVNIGDRWFRIKNRSRGRKPGEPS